LSRTLAILLGITALLLDTYLRWNAWQADALSILDDYILAGCCFTVPGASVRMPLPVKSFWSRDGDLHLGICTRPGLCERGFPTPTGPRRRFRSGRNTQ